MSANSLLNSKEVSQQIIKFISSSFKKSGFSKTVIGLSGGIDSTASYVLAGKALGEENVFPYTLPYGNLNETSVGDVKLLARNLTTIDIKPLVDPIIALDKTMDDIRKGNIMARMRMILLFDAAKYRKALVLGTENKTEHLLGYYTRFGDAASDVEPIRGLYKTQVKELGNYLNIPEKIITKPPTAGLWEEQTDEGEFGFSYKEADGILFLKFDEKLSMDEIIGKGFKKEVVEKVMERVEKNEFKEKLPYTP